MPISSTDNPTELQREDRLVAILFDPEGTWSLKAIEGIAEYARRQGRWRLLCAPRNRGGRIELPPGWRGHGILTRFLTKEFRKECLAYGIPVVDLEAIVKGRYVDRLATVATNNQSRAKMVVEHLQSLHLEHFACFNPPHPEYSQERVKLIKALLQEQRIGCDLFWKRSAQVWYDLDWEEQQNHIQAWIKTLRPHTGVVTPDGRQGRLLSEWCYFLGIRIPDDLAVVTCDDDDLLSSISSPPLSGVALASKRHGYAAAELLEEMMNGNPAPKEPILIDPLHVVTRQSTDFLTQDNPVIVRAIRYIRENACVGIRVIDVVKHLAVSRRSLEQQFQAAVGHSLGQEIRKSRFEKALWQLSNTDMSVEEIAVSCGFSTGAHLCRSFQQNFGESPLAYRKRSRP
ncbi:MAG: substrate-binding domain-containing protein [Blastopirellula sp. JB062]